MKIIVLVLVFILMSPFGNSQPLERHNEALFQILYAKDQALFQQGFNQCKLDVTASLMTDDLEFYHDKSGISTGKDNFLNTMRAGLCKSGKNEINRHLVEDSLKVFPMSENGKLYGAIQMGEHGFAPVGEPVSVPPAKFIHLWLLQDDGEWRIARVMSYDHN